MILPSLLKLLPIVGSFIGFGALIAVHEFGHFLFCKLFKIHTPTFSIGFGPEIYNRKIGQTNFRLAAIPFGGYVEIAGLAEVGQGDQAHAEDRSDNSFEQKPYWQKVFVLLGGIIFNILFAYLAFSTIFIVGNRTAKKSLTILSINQDSSAQQAGLKEKDIIIGINDTILSTDPVKLNNEKDSVLINEIRNSPNKPISLLIKRGMEQIKLSITPKEYNENGNTIGIIGAAFQPPQLPFWYSLKAGFDYSVKILGLITKGLKQLFTSKSLDGAAGPVMILAQGASTAKHGIIPFLHFLGVISLSLAIMNLLPIGALDGGQLLFTTIEFITRRKIPEFIKITINLASWVLLIGLMLYFTFKELVMLFGPGVKTLLGKILNFFK